MSSYGAESVARTLMAAESEAARYNSVLEQISGAYSIDEVALLVSDNSQLEHLDHLLCRDFGWEKFNSAHDSVRTAPIRSGYTVEYNFFRREGIPWRLEVMRLSSGLSPLHSAIPLPLARQVCTPVHASFKVPDEDNYAVARFELDGLGYVLAQQCDSTYGSFSYWTKIGLPVGRVPYLKPRVNLRDAEL